MIEICDHELNKVKQNVWLMCLTHTRLAAVFLMSYRDGRKLYGYYLLNMNDAICISVHMA